PVPLDTQVFLGLCPDVAAVDAARVLEPDLLDYLDHSVIVEPEALRADEPRVRCTVAEQVAEQIDEDVDRLLAGTAVLAAEHAVAIDAADRRRHREGAEERLAEVGVPDQQPALGQAEQLRLRRVGDRPVRRVDDLLVPDAAVEGRAAVPADLAVDPRAELLGTEEHHVEVAPAGGDVDEGVAQAPLAAGRGVLVQLIDEHDQLVNAELGL